MTKKQSEININEIGTDPAGFLDDNTVSRYAAKLIRRYQTMRCKTCRYKNEYGDCDNPKLTDSLPDNHEMEIDTDDMLIYSYNEGGGFRVGDKFGCVHHKERSETT